MEEILEILGREYGIEIKEIRKIKSVYKIFTENKVYCLKIINYDFKHFWFILCSIKHLMNRESELISYIIKNIYGKDYIEINNGYAYLTKWEDGVRSDFSNRNQVDLISREIAKLHMSSEGFKLTKEMNPRIGWMSWIKTFYIRKTEIVDFKHRINQKAYKDKFDLSYLSYVDKMIEKANDAIVNLYNSKYIQSMKKEINKRGFCHHDLANHNILVKENIVKFVDFDYCILDTHIHDLASFLVRVMKDNMWQINIAQDIITNYSKEIEILPAEIDFMKEFIRFPQEFWQLGIQKYWEQQRWKEELFLTKLNKYIESEDIRNELIRFL